MSYDPSANQPGQFGQPGQYGQPAPPPPAPGYGAPGPYPGGAYGAPGYGAPAGQMPPTYRAWAITCIVLGVFFSLILGMPFGITANHYAGKVQRSWQMGDVQGALTASKRARTWAIVSTIFIVLGFVGFIYIASHGSNTNG